MWSGEYGGYILHVRFRRNIHRCIRVERGVTWFAEGFGGWTRWKFSSFSLICTARKRDFTLGSRQRTRSAYIYNASGTLGDPWREFRTREAHSPLENRKGRRQEAKRKRTRDRYCHPLEDEAKQKERSRERAEESTILVCFAVRIPSAKNQFYTLNSGYLFFLLRGICMHEGNSSISPPREASTPWIKFIPCRIQKDPSGPDQYLTNPLLHILAQRDTRYRWEKNIDIGGTKIKRASLHFENVMATDSATPEKERDHPDV